MKFCQIQFIIIKFPAKTKTKIQTGGKNHIQIACFQSTFSEIVSIKGTKIGIIVQSTKAII